MKIETILSGSAERIAIGDITVYPLSKGFPHRPLNIVRISKAIFRGNPELCGTEFVKALRGLPAGFYTLVHESGYVVDFYLGKRGGLRLRPHDGRTINDPQRRPCLRIEVTP